MILLTGANGFLGRKLLSHLSSSGLDVVPLYRSSEVIVNEDKWEADLTCKDHMLQLKEDKQAPSTIIHLAGYIDISLRTSSISPFMSPVPGRQNIPGLYISNVVGTANILDYSLYKGVKHIIYASSQTVYGMPKSGKLTEQSPCVPLEHYAMSKLCGESLLKVSCRQGTAITVLRFPGLYGEDLKEGILYSYCISAIRKNRIVVNADIPLPIDVIHVDDVVNAFEKALSFGGEYWNCFNIATGEPCSLNYLADEIAGIIPGCRVVHSELQQPIVCMDPSKAFSVLDWQALPRRTRLLSLVKRLQSSI